MSDNPIVSPTMLSLANVALRLDVSIKTIRRIVDQKKIRVHRVGKQLRVTEEALEAYLKRGRE